MPPGRFNTHVAGNGNCWGGYSQLLPQLEQQALFNSFNFSLAPELEASLASAAANSTGAATFINALLCPTDPAPAVAHHRRRRELRLAQLRPERRLELPARWRPSRPASPRRSPARPTGRSSRTGGSARPSSLDGMSNTVAVSETIRSNATSTYATDPDAGLPRHRRQQDDRPAADLRRRLRLALPGPALDDDPVPGHQGGPLALRCARAHHVQPPPAAQRPAARLPGRPARTATSPTRTGATSR